ncbi:MAG: SH3 domain-containing protein [Actinobacteria bacterium]|nr:SH3 domain-containing protein [Actinomycetota bacterium]
MQLTFLRLFVTSLFLAVLAISGCTLDDGFLVNRDKGETGKPNTKQHATTSATVPQSTTTTNTLSPRSSKFLQSAKVDLNGDGVIDIIRFDCPLLDESIVVRDTYTLYINNSSVRGEGSNLDGYFRIVDIDQRDNVKEISVGESGPSDDYATAFYYYDGNKIVFMGKVQGADNELAKDIKIDGSGTLHTRTRGEILHTWFYPDSYRLSKAHTLERISQDLYEMNWKVKVVKELPLQTSRTNPKTSVVLQPGEEVTILKSDDKEWCLVENSKGIKGWFAVEDFSVIKGTGLEASRFFEGLSGAD